jgi:PAS domain S-box-containing protein
MSTTQTRASDALLEDIPAALDEVDVPAYALDTSGVIRWLNSAAIKIVGDARGQHFTSVVVPEQSLEARETFTRNVLGSHGITGARFDVRTADGRRVTVEICSAPLRDGHRVIGMFGLGPWVEEPLQPRVHRHLTPRQHQILRYLGRGASTHQIAKELHLAIETVRNHIRALLRALGAHTRVEAVAIAYRDGLLTA